MRHIATLLVFLTCPLFAAEPDAVRLVEDREHLVRQLQIRATDGKVAVADIVRAVCRVNGYDDKELRGSIPCGRIALNGKAARWMMSAFNRVARPGLVVSADGPH